MSIMEQKMYDQIESGIHEREACYARIKELEEALNGIRRCCSGNEPKHEQIYHIANDVLRK